MRSGATSLIKANYSIPAASEFFLAVFDGLSSEQKTLPPKYFYDAQGARLFDQLCELEEYYPYRTELRLLPRVASDLAELFRAKKLGSVNVVEFGAGSLHKIKPLLNAMGMIRRFTAIDICGDHLQRACRTLAEEFPALEIEHIEGDFTKPLDMGAHGGTPLGFFPGSTIGNFAPDEAVAFLTSARQTLGPGSYMLVGVDTKKSEAILYRAYNDHQGLTARFNKNILERINRELGGQFNVDDFEHQAWYSRDHGRVEMHLCSQRRHRVRIQGYDFAFERGETIHTENSYKYHPHEFAALARRAGWRTCKGWLAEGGMFSAALLRCDA